VAAADSMMARLSELLRMTLENNGADENTVAEELQLLDAYLSIEQIRLRDRLSTELKIDPETLDALIPHLLLQPLAENAIRHGISKKPAGGTIRVSLARSNSKLRLVLSDNGPGFAAKPGESEPGLGLTITRERLQALYGTKHFFSIRSTAGGGVEVTIEVPFHTRIETTKAMEQSR
jgi:two-component system LytT family sensor kinase